MIITPIIFKKIQRKISISNFEHKLIFNQCLLLDNLYKLICNILNVNTSKL